jgi:hypothetical protein
MKREVLGAVLGLALLAFAAVAAGADELTVNSILAAQRSGASAEGIVAMVNNPANTIAMTRGSRDAAVAQAFRGRPLRDLGPPGTHAGARAAQPDDARLVGIVGPIGSGMSGSIIAEQVRRSGETCNLSVNDLLTSSRTVPRGRRGASGDRRHAPTAPAAALPAASTTW